MEEKMYCVLIEDEIVATGMDSEIAILLVKAIFEEYYNEKDLSVTVRRETGAECI